MLQLVAAWQLGHCGAAEESFTLCKEVIISAYESNMEWIPLLHYLIAKHVEQANLLLRQPSSEGNMNLTWQVLHQAEACLQTDLVALLDRQSKSSRSWADTMLSQV